MPVIALLLQPTLSFAWDVLFFARGLTLQELAGAVIMLGAIYLGSKQGLLGVEPNFPCVASDRWREAGRGNSVRPFSGSRVHCPYA